MNAVVRRAWLAVVLVFLALPALAEDSPNTGGVESTAAFARAEDPKPDAPPAAPLWDGIEAARGLAPPRYPVSALREGRGGVVGLVVSTDNEGRVLKVRVETSSGHADLDAAAVETARGWRLSPYYVDGVQTGGDFRVPITFDPGE